MIGETESGSHDTHPYRGWHRIRGAQPGVATPISKSSRLAAILVLTFAMICVWLAVIALRERRLTHAVRDLPGDVQAATYRRAYEELSTACATQPALADRCSDEAEFILRFPQCTADCQKLARRYFPVVRK